MSDCLHQRADGTCGAEEDERRWHNVHWYEYTDGVAIPNEPVTSPIRLRWASVKYHQQWTSIWPEDAEANFYMQAPNTYARDKWLRELRKASLVTLDALLDLSIVELKQRCVASA